MTNARCFCAIPMLGFALPAAPAAPVAARDTGGRLSVERWQSKNVILFETRDPELVGGWLHRSYVGR